MPKFDKSEITCNCLGAGLSNQQKYFLTRKRQPQDSQSPQSNRRVIKSTELKNESEGKGQKKSLKKRPGSFVHSDHNYQNSETNKPQNDIKPNILQEVPIKTKNHEIKGSQTSTYNPKNLVIFNFPQSTTVAKGPSFLSNQREQPETKSNNFQFTNPFLSIPPKPIQPIRKNIQFGYTQMYSPKPNSQRQQLPKFVQIQPKDISIAHNDTRPIVSARQINSKEYSSIRIPVQSQKIIRSHTENWSSPNQDPLLIEDFQQLFRNKQDNRNEINFSKPRTNLKPREAQKSKRFQQQQLIGRFAQSEDQEASESPPSEVIGKGFDRTYQDFIDQEYPIIGEETKASRSTNTKVSNLKGQRPHFDEHQKTKFGNLAHFTSYDRL